ncbi:hypothetical protein MLD52_09010 [Puniceicoccaceae bacterium K14]|nr:hypothetical protein [Puniceicoccaceae bacterium K14]
MNTAFQTGPGVYALATDTIDENISKDTVRVYFARLEAYDMPKEDAHNNSKYRLLVSMAEDSPEIAQALLRLSESIEINRDNLEDMAKGASE